MDESESVREVENGDWAVMALSLVVAELFVRRSPCKSVSGFCAAE